VLPPLGRGDEAVRLLRQVLERQSRKFGPTHRETVLTRFSLAVVLRRGRVSLDEAEVLEAECVGQFRQLLGADHPLTLSAMNELTQTYLNRDEPARAEQIASRALQAARSRMGTQHPITREAMRHLASAYRSQGKYAEAAPLIAELVAEPRTDPESGRPRGGVVAGLTLLGRELIRQGKHAEAERALRDGLKLLEKYPAHSARMNSRGIHHVLGASLLGQKKYPEAESELLQGYQDMKPPGPFPVAIIRLNQIEALGWLVQLYEEWGKPDQAARWRKERDALRSPQGGAVR
jgi:non-specific serine/threonine protein kinase/serine/threonine-protein kinase